MAQPPFAAMNASVLLAGLQFVAGTCARVATGASTTSIAQAAASACARIAGAGAGWRARRAMQAGTARCGGAPTPGRGCAHTQRLRAARRARERRARAAARKAAACSPTRCARARLPQPSAGTRLALGLRFPRHHTPAGAPQRRSGDARAACVCGVRPPAANSWQSSVLPWGPLASADAALKRQVSAHMTRPEWELGCEQLTEGHVLQLSSWSCASRPLHGYFPNVSATATASSTGRGPGGGGPAAATARCARPRALERSMQEGSTPQQPTARARPEPGGRHARVGTRTLTRQRRPSSAADGQTRPKVQRSVLQFLHQRDVPYGRRRARRVCP
jgi:hypothetical protein